MTDPNETPGTTAYTGVLTALRTVQRKDGGSFQSFRLISAARKKEPEFTIDVPAGIDDGTSVDIVASVQKYPWRSRGKLLFAFDRRVVKMEAT